MGGTKRPLWEEDDDLIQKILVWLPVVSLLRFKSVCKSWCALIESSFFIHLQHTTSKSSSSSSSSHNFGSFILHVEVKFPRFRETALLMLSSESESESECVSRSRCSRSFSLWVTGSNRVCVCGWSAPISDYKFGKRWWSSYGYCGQCYKWNFSRVSNDHQLVLKLDNLGFPSCYQFDDNKKIIKPPPIVIGSCNGLICLHDSELNDVSLWNPATRQFRILPKSITIDGDCLHHRLFAFGFDDETKDYKVVLLSGLRPRPRPRRIIDDDDGLSVVVGRMGCLCRVQVYSLSTDSWRLLEGITYLPGSPFHCPDSSSSGIYLNGRYFFMAKYLYDSEHPPKYNDRFIISLDLTKEIIIPIQLPNNNLHLGLYLCCLGDKIALFTKFTGGNATIGRWEGFHIWVLLNKHSSSSSSSSSSVNNESWKQLHSSFKVELLPDEWNIPISISNDGVFALLETVSGFHNKKKKMKLYNLITKKVKKTFLSCNQVLSKAYAYKPSLVSIIAAAAAAADKVMIGEAAAAADKVIVKCG